MRIVKPAIVRKSELLDTAMRLFATKGYDNTSISDVIAAVGVSKGAFYHHFTSKEQLLAGLAARYAASAAKRAQSVLDDPTLDAFERLSVFLSRMRHSKLEDAAELHAAFAPVFRPENVQLYEQTQAAVNAVIGPMLTRIIAEGVADRTFDAGDPKAAAEVILHTMSSTRPLVAALYCAKSQAEIDSALKQLVARVRYLGTVVDRILGIPEGSLELADEESVCEIANTWRAATEAA